MTLPGTGTGTPAQIDDQRGFITVLDPHLLVRDGENFRAGEIHNHREVWDRLMTDLSNRHEIMNWITNGIAVKDFVKPFKGKFGGYTYDSAYPVNRLFSNHDSCGAFASFISQTITERLAVGAVSVLGRVGQSQTPSIVMPLTVQPTKPRLCQDQRYLNCWMKDMPFRLDSLIDLTRYVEKEHFQSKLDDKSGYDHVLMDEESKSLMGFQWGGWWFVSNVLPFGWKMSPYIYTNHWVW